MSDTPLDRSLLRPLEDQVLFDLGTPKPPQMIEEEFVIPRPPDPDRTKIMEFEPPLAGATFSEDRVFRYTLWRRFKESGKTLAFIGLNPSTADEKIDDPTVRRCINYAKRDGYAQLIMLNLFAFRATLPKDMRAAKDPGGPDHAGNLMAIIETCAAADKVILAWGNHGSFKGAGRALYKSLVNAQFQWKLYCLGMNKDTSPVHPLYQPSAAPFIPFGYGMTNKQKKCKHEKQSWDKNSNLFHCDACGVLTGHGDPIGALGERGPVGAMFEEDLQ